MRDRIGKIEVETGHLVQMVSELLDLSRIESGGTITAVDLLDLGPDRHRVDRAAPPLRRSPGRGLARRRRPKRAAGSWRRGSPRAGVRQPAAQRGQVQPRRRRRRRDRAASRTAGSSAPSPIRGSASRRRPRRGSSSASTRSTGRESGVRPAAPGLGSRSRGTSSTSTVARSGSSRSRVPVRRSRSASRSPTRPTELASQEIHGHAPRRDAQHPEHGRPLVRAAAAPARRHGRPPARRARAPGGGLPDAAGPAHRRGG